MQLTEGQIQEVIDRSLESSEIRETDTTLDAPEHDPAGVRSSTTVERTSAGSMYSTLTRGTKRFRSRR